MKAVLLSCFLLQGIFCFGQRISLFGNFTFDSTYSIVALSSSFTEMDKDSKEFCFLVSNVDEMNSMKKDWTVKSEVRSLAVEKFIVTIFVLHNKNIVSSGISIYPEQGIIHYDNSWYDFDMKKFKKIESENPLRYHSRSLSFTDYLDYGFFRDSLQDAPDFLFLFAPTAKKFEGYFNVVSSRSPAPDSPIFVLHDINEELKAQFPAEKFEAENIINDTFNLNNKRKLKTKVKCSKALYDKYESKRREKGDWTPTTFDTKVIFKE